MCERCEPSIYIDFSKILGAHAAALNKVGTRRTPPLDNL